MSFNIRSVGFGDERRDDRDRDRRPRGKSPRGYDSFKPDRDRQWDRDYRDHRDRDYDRDRDRDLLRRDSESDSRRRILPIDTNVATTRPRGSVGLESSPSTARATTSSVRATPDRPAAVRMNSTSSASATTPMVPIPKAKDPRVQEHFAATHSTFAAAHRRSRELLKRDHKRKEMERRKNDSRKFHTRGASDFASVAEMARKMEQRDYAEYDYIKKAYAEADGKFCEEVEKFATLLHQQSQAPPAQIVQSPNLSISELKSTLDEFNQQLLETKKKVLEHEKERHNTIDILSKTQSRCSDLEEDHKNLRAENNLLQSRLKYLRERFQHLESEKSSSDNRLAEAENAIQELRKSKALSADLQEAIKRVNGLQGENDQRQEEMRNLDTRMKENKEMFLELQSADFERQNRFLELQNTVSENKNRISENKNQLSVVSSKFDAIDWITLNEVADQWVGLNIENKLTDHDEQLSNTLNELRALKESTQMAQKAKTPTDESNQSIAELRISSEKRCADLRMEILEEFDRKITNTRSTFEQMVSDMGEVCGTMIEEIGAKVDKIEQNLQSRGSLTAAAQLQGLNTAVDRQLEIRVTQLEDQGEYIRQELQKFQGRDESIISNTVTQHVGVIKEELDDLRKIQEGQQMSINVLDNQYNNIFTKPLADMIVKHLDNMGQRLGPRIDSTELKLNQLVQEIQMMKDIMRQINDSHKRSASPNKEDAEETKRRRIDPVGDMN